MSAGRGSPAASSFDNRTQSTILMLFHAVKTFIRIEILLQRDCIQIAAMKPARFQTDVMVSYQTRLRFSTDSLGGHISLSVRNPWGVIGVYL